MSMATSVQLHTTHLNICFQDGAAIDYDYLWLRDNCPSAFHPKTKERNFNLLSVSDDIKAIHYELKDNLLAIQWSEHNHQSEYDLAWLKAHAHSEGFGNFLMMPQPMLWQSDFHPNSFPYEKLISSDQALYEWLQDLSTTGLSMIKGMPANEESMEAIAHRIGHLRQTNFGVIFTVQSKPNPNNQAYTSEALPLHTDLPNQETPPGYQFLHCLQNEATGGESIFVDGFSAAEQLKKEHPEYFQRLVNQKIPFRFHDEHSDIREMRPVISVVDNEVNEIIFNAHIAATFNFPAHMMREYYLAYRTFIRLLNSPQLLIEFKLEASQMVVFDNRRVLHGRKSFNPQTGMRRLRGCYIDRTEFKSQYRKLKQKLTVT